MVLLGGPVSSTNPLPSQHSKCGISLGSSVPASCLCIRLTLSQCPAGGGGISGMCHETSHSRHNSSAAKPGLCDTSSLHVILEVDSTSRTQLQGSSKGTARCCWLKTMLLLVLTWMLMVHAACYRHRQCGSRGL